MNHFLDKIQKCNDKLFIKSNRWFLLGVILSWVLSFYFVLIRIAPPLWDTNDDIGQSMTVHGYGVAAYGIPNLPHSNIVWGYCILLLSKALNSSIPAYSLATLGILVLCTFGLSYMIALKTKNILVALLCTILIFAQPIVRPQFTLLAGFTTLLGLFLLLVSQSFRGKTRFAIGIFLVFLGFLIRKEEMFLIAGISLPLISWNAWLSDRFIIGIVAMLMLGIGLAGWWDNKMMDEKTAYKNNYPLARIIDYGSSANLEISEKILNQNGLSKNDYALLSNWFFVDSILTDPKRLAKVVDDAKAPINLRDLLNQILKGFSALVSENILILFAASVVIFVFFPSRQLLYIWLLAITALLLFSYLGRPFPYRVIYPLLAFCMCTPFIVQQESKAFSFHRTCFLLSILAILSALHLFSVLQQGNRREWKALNVQRMVQNFPAVPVVVWPADFPSELVYPVFQRRDQINKLKLYTIGGILAQYPNSFARIESKEGRNILQLFYSSNGVSVLGFASRFLLLENYCKERNGAYRDLLLSTIEQCELRQCFCEN
jgi:hypothetical protein